jgi:flagellar motor switch protein FliN/FliY
MTESTVAAATDAESTFAAMAAVDAAVDAAVVPSGDDVNKAAGRKRASKGDDAGAKALLAAAGADRLDLLSNVEMDVTAELGRTRMTVRELLSLTPGIVVELDRMAGSPIDLFVNGTLIARGEVVVIDEEFGVRISEIVGPGATENGR